MKKLLFTIGLALTIFSVQATPNIIYRLVFVPDSMSCGQGYWLQPAGGGAPFNIPPGGWQIHSGDTVEVLTDPQCCSDSPKQVGWLWEYSSSDGGNTWTAVASGTHLPVWQPPGTCDNYWTFGINPIGGGVSISMPGTLGWCAPQPQGPPAPR